MRLATAPYAEQCAGWPSAGRHILAHYDQDTIVVYQAYAPAIATYALEHGCFGGGFSYQRMSWVKPNFLWMMYRSDWGRAPGQERVLAVRLRRAFFESLLARAVASSFRASGYTDEGAWKAAVQRSEVRLQWDPDHLPSGQPCARRALQLGLRGSALDAYGRAESLEIIDMSSFVAEQRENARHGAERLVMPIERVYPLSDAKIAEAVGLADRLG
jgi:hypothetical protein